VTTATRNGTFPSDARTAAELYLSKGLSPIPLPDRSKDPGYPGWQHLRLTRDVLDARFPPGEPHNIAILNGEPSGNTLDADLDCAEAILAAPRLLPPTGWVFGRKSAPKSHLIYRADRSLEAAQEKYADLDGAVLVELRGTGGMTVFPPSTHKETGERITWDSFGDLGEVKLVELQQAIRQLAAVALLARHWPTKGTRQDAFLSLVGGLLRSAWNQDQVERFVEALALATQDDEVQKRVQAVALTAAKLQEDRKATGWPKLEGLIGENGKSVVRRVREWLGMAWTAAAGMPAAKKGRKLEPFQPFPIEVLPSPIDEFVRQGSRALGCDPAYLALPALAVTASAIGNTRTIRLKRGWDEPCIVWSVILGDSGTLKSPAYLKVVVYLFHLQRQLLLEFKQKKAKYQEELRAYKTAKAKAREEGTDPGDPPKEPLLQRVIVSDTTVEKLAEILEDNPHGTLVARDELAGWLGSFTRYKGQKGGTDLPNWLEMHRAGTVIVDRKTSERQTLFIHRAAVSITGGIQPAVLARALTPEFLDAGLAARLLMAMPPKLPKRWSEVEVSPDVEQAYQAVLDKLLALEFDTRDGEKAPHVLTLSTESKDAWVVFYDQWAMEQSAVEGELAAAFSKLEAYAARFAILHHVIGRVARGEDDLVPVQKVSIDAGVTLCRWFATEARRIYTTLSESNEERDTRRLVEFIQARGGSITVRGLMRANCRRYPDAQSAESALVALIQAGLAQWIELPPKTKGKPIKAVELRMTHDTHDKDTDGGDDDGPDPDDSPDDTDPDSDSDPDALRADESDCDCLTSPQENPVMPVMRHAEAETEAPQGTPSESGCHQGNGRVSPGVMRSSLALTAHGESPPPLNFRLVRQSDELPSVAAAADGTAMIGLDLETTGLNPRADRVRLLSLAVDTIDGGTFCYLVDCFAVDPSPLWDALAGKELVLHNAAFDLAFMARLGFTPTGKVRDTMLLAQLLTAGTLARVTLAACCQRWLQRTLDKAEQKSDWSGELSDDQLAYAARDVEVLVPLLKVLAAKIKEAGLVEAAKIEHRCLPVIVWMGSQGVALDRDAWQSLAHAAGEEADRLRQELHEAAPHKPGELFSRWNWDSPQQAQQALELAGCKVKDTADETLAAIDHPLAQLLRGYRLARKRSNSYGTDWLAHVAADGRIYPSWRQIGAAPGRMSCSDPNMQQLPRGAYRSCIVAPPGRILVKADFSQIELRIAAKVSGDKALLEAYQRGDDLHTRTARNVLGIEDVTKQHRQLAKALNFGLLYGMGGKGFQRYAKSQYGLELTEGDAGRYRDAFFKTYPGLATWHRRVRATKVTETRTLVGRRRLLTGKTPDTHRLNTPVQGTGADGLKLALALLWERRDQAPGAFPVLAVHDEIVVEAPADQAEATASWLKTAMRDTMAPLIAPVPVEVEVNIAPTWGG
jgi:DNA polymerase I-like protein with 3'-5' exonuclease and polymerase domains